MRKGAEKLSKFLQAKQQGRLDGFFTVQQQKSSPEKGSKGKDKGSAKGTKRKVRYISLFLELISLTTGHRYRVTIRRKPLQARRAKRSSDPFPTICIFIIFFSVCRVAVMMYIVFLLYNIARK